MPNLAQRILNFYKHFNIAIPLPKDIAVLDPFHHSPAAYKATTLFFEKFYKDQQKRFMLIGINPGRLGSGFTGIPFTDSIRLRAHCKLPFEGPDQGETSSAFMYSVIEQMGGAKAFFADFYFSSVCPQGFIKRNAKGHWVNYNYYEDPQFLKRLYPSLVEALQQQKAFGMHPTAVCIGQGKNFQILHKINQEFKLFKQLIPMEHPRFIMQYKSAQKSAYIQKYVETFQTLIHSV